MEKEIIEIIIQFILLVVAGGYITQRFTKAQRDKEARQNIIQEFSAIFSQFIALRFKANVHLLQDDDCYRYSLLEATQIRVEILKCYNESCELLGRYQAIKPLIQINFNIDDEEIDTLHQFYQTWRRSLRESKPVYQSDCPDNDAEYKKLRTTYHKIIGAMKAKS